MNELNSIYHDLLGKTNTNFIRYLYKKVNWNARLIAITGARGVGKTTMLLQHIKLSGNEKNSIYISADNIYFAGNTIFEFAGTFYKYGGKYFYIDEVHKYSNWSREIKNLYDSYPDLHIILTGSSILDIYHGFGDLSRRVLAYFLNGLSFREFLLFDAGIKHDPLKLHDIINHNTNFKLDKPLLHFSNYLKYGYYPFYKEDDFNIRLNAAINTIIEVDIPKYMELKVATIEKLKHLLQIIAESAPFKPNMSKIAELLSVSRNLLPDYFLVLERTKLIMQLKSKTKGIRASGKVQKVYLNNTNLMKVLTTNNDNKGNSRETFFLNQISCVYKCTAPEKADFFVQDKYTFEIGGKNKRSSQISDLNNAFIIKDDIEHGFGNTIPLWYFGFLY